MPLANSLDRANPQMQLVTVGQSFSRHLPATTVPCQSRLYMEEAPRVEPEQDVELDISQLQVGDGEPLVSITLHRNYR